MEESTSHEQAKDLAELKKQHAVLEERMKTLQSDLQGTLERFRADMANWKTDMKTDMARRDIEAGKRENRSLIAILGGIAVATAILGALISGIPAA